MLQEVWQIWKNASQIEKEVLAIIFTVKKFHRIILERKFILQTDHCTWLSIFGSKKGIPMHAANGLLWFYWTMISRWNFYHRKNLDMWMACPDIKM